MADSSLRYLVFAITTVVLLLLFSLAFAEPPRSSSRNSNTIRDLLGPALVAVREALGRDDAIYHGVLQGNQIKLTNPFHNLEVQLGLNGMEVKSEKDNWRLTWKGHGYVSAPALEERSVILTAEANCVEYQHGAVTEWYVNSPDGVGQNRKSSDNFGGA